MGYRDLIDISLNVDASELYAKLEQLDGGADTRLGSLEERVKSIEEGGYPVDQDKVEDIIASYLVDENYQTRRDVENFDYLNESRVDEIVSEKLRDTEYGARLDALETQADTLDNQVGTLAKRYDDEKSIESLVERLDVQANNLTNLTQDFDVHIKSLEEQVKAQDSAVDSLQEQLRTMQRDMLALSERNDTALTFFDLIKQAFALLQR